MDNTKIWDKLKQPPPSALKPIEAGRLRGKHDINPQWRYQAMTEVFGVCGIGWKYTIEKIWREDAIDGEVFAFAQVSIQIKQGDTWSEPIQGIGGSMLIEKETRGLYVNDEGYKMAITDALGVAMKMLGVAADVYLGNYDSSKYTAQKEYKKPSIEPPKPKEDWENAPSTLKQQQAIHIMASKLGIPEAELFLEINNILKMPLTEEEKENFKLIASTKELTQKQASDLIGYFNTLLSKT